MDFTIQQVTDNICWQEVNQLLNGFGLTNHTVAETQQVFETSQEVVFLIKDQQVIGCGRALTDYIAQASIYNIAVDERFHSQGLGKLIVDTLVQRVKNCNIVLYTHPDTVGWYQQLGFKKMKTGLAIYHADHVEEMKEMGFI